MTYTAFDPAKPDGSTQNGTQVLQSVRDNMLALRDGFISGTLSGYNPGKVNGTGTASQPQYFYWTKGAETIRAEVTWGTTGGANGNPEVIQFYYSSDTRGSWTALTPYYKLTFTYDSDGIPSGDPFGTWSN